MSADSPIVSIAEATKMGQCILFLGAGVHSPPPAGPYEGSYPEEQRPLTGRALSEQLAKKCDFAEQFPNESTSNLQRVAMFYEAEKGRQELVKEVTAAVQTDKKPSPVLRNGLAALNFPLVITTNYDRLFERALSGVEDNKDASVGVYDKKGHTPTTEFRDPTTRKPFVFKIHGDINHPESIVITDEDYIQFVLRMSDKDPYHPVPETFRFNFKRWPTLFVGYSLMDYNLRLLFKTLHWKLDKSMAPGIYSVDPYPDRLVVKVMSSDSDEKTKVNFIAQDVWTFVPELYRLVTGKEMPP